MTKITDKAEYLAALEDEVIRERYNVGRLIQENMDLQNTIDFLYELGEEKEVFIQQELRKRDNKKVFLLPRQTKRGNK